MITKIVLKTSGFKEGEAELRKMVRTFKPAIRLELAIFAQEGVDKLKELVYGNQLKLPPKKRPNGKPPLLDSEKYIKSFKVSYGPGLSAGFGPTGENDNMSNEALGELLEYGNAQIPARPHIRPLGIWIERRLYVLAERIAKRLVGDR